MNIQSLEKVVQKYKEKIEKLKKENAADGSRSFHDITGNALVSSQTLIDIYRSFSEKAKDAETTLKPVIISDLQMLNLYLRLIDTNPEFADNEMKKRKEYSAFADIRELNPKQYKEMGYRTSNQAYVHLASKRLSS
ncbi:MAG: hypothetical protein AABX85_02245 [Nanoarchaeota archaeon]